MWNEDVKGKKLSKFSGGKEGNIEYKTILLLTFSV
jgi:hypothetical protein